MPDRPTLPTRERILLGPGPSVIAPRVMRAMAAPVLSHLDPDLVCCSTTCAKARSLFGARGDADAGGPGTGRLAWKRWWPTWSAGTRVLVVVTGYFGERLAELCRRYGGTMRLDVEWGRAVIPRRSVPRS